MADSLVARDRLSEADPEVRLAIALPDHPSYPSDRGCLSGAAAAALDAFFPGDAARPRAMADEAAFSGVVAGLHYRFDGEAGLAIGRAAARIAIEADRAADR